MQKSTLCIICVVCAVFCFSCISTPEPEHGKQLSIHQMILSGKGLEIRDQFQTKVDVNLKDENGDTPLHAAAQVNDSDMVTFLIIKGADTEIKNNFGDTPLFTAIRNNAPQAASDLVQLEADIFARDATGITPLEAAIKGGEKMYSVFLTPKTGELRDENGNTVMHYLVKTQNLAALETAIQKKLLVSAVNASKKTPLELALEKPEDTVSIKIAAALVLANAPPAYGDFAYFETAVKMRNPNMRFNDGQTPVQIAALQGHTGIIDYFIERGTSVSAKDVSGATALHYAVRNGDLDITAKLLQAGADVNSPDSSGKTPLLCIISSKNRLAMYDLLLSKNANPNAKDMFGDTALHMATMLNAEADVLQKLTAMSADIDERNKKGSTPLAVAIETKNKEHTSFYVTAGANIHSEDINGDTPLIQALKNGKVLFTGTVIAANIGTRDSFGNTPLHIAVQQKADAFFITHLFNLGADVNARNRQGDSPLSIAVDKNYRETGEILLSRGADVFGSNSKNYSPLHTALERGGVTREWLLASSVIEAADGVGNTPLHYAAEWKFDDSISYLIQKGARINSRNANGETPLFSAVKADSPTTVELLLKNGSNRENRDFLGNTALHAGARRSTERAAVTLMRNGADVNAQNLAGKTPLAESVRMGILRMATLYLDNGANSNIADITGKTVLIDAIQTKNINAVKLLLSRGALVTMQDMYGRNAYHEASLTGDIQIINMIATAGGNPFSRDLYGKTPFSLVLNSSSDAIKAVLGTNITAMDSDGNTPLHIAVAERAPSQTLELLIDMKCPLDSRNRNGLTPLLMAVRNSEYKQALTLLSFGADTYLADTSGNSPLSLLLSSSPENLSDFIRIIGGKTDISGDGILHYAARTADETTIENLLAFGLDKNILNISGERPYDIALRWQRTQAAALLK